VADIWREGEHVAVIWREGDLAISIIHHPFSSIFHRTTAATPSISSNLLPQASTSTAKDNISYALRSTLSLIESERSQKPRRTEFFMLAVGTLFHVLMMVIITS